MVGSLLRLYKKIGTDAKVWHLYRLIKCIETFSAASTASLLYFRVCSGNALCSDCSRALTQPAFDELVLIGLVSFHIIRGSILLEALAHELRCLGKLSHADRHINFFHPLRINLYFHDNLSLKLHE